MRLSLRAKLLAIVGTAAIAMLGFSASEILVARQLERQFTTVQERLVPRAELRPELERQFEQLRRSLQDAVAASDSELLEATRDLKLALRARVAASGPAIEPKLKAQLDAALEDYYAAAYDVSHRVIEGETGEGLVDDMARMQTKQTRAAEVLKRATTFDRAEIGQAFAAIARANETATRWQLVFSLGSLVLLTLISLGLSRGVLNTLFELTAGFTRFGKGKFDEAIPVRGDDELASLARHANRMAESLQRLGVERDRGDWLKAGTAGLAQELRGELELEEVAGRAVRFLTRYLNARVAALYSRETDGSLRLIGQYAFAGQGVDADATREFRPGQGLVGQAALQEELLVIDDPPPTYLRVSSGLGETAPQVIALVPLLYVGKVIGVLELGFLSSWSEPSRELLLGAREILAISLEVARGRGILRDLLEESQKQAARLAAQEEKLQSTNEELLAQQEELRQTNEELTEQTAELEAQRAMLEHQNAELVETRRRLEQKASELTTVSKYKSQFLANMSHELRTPLNSMLLLSNLLGENEAGNLTEKQVEFAKTINTAGKDLLTLINQVLDLARVEAGKHDVQLQRISLSSMIDHARRVFEPLAQEKSLTFVAEVEPGLPEAIVTDGQRVHQILNNLLGNAVKFTERGQIGLRICRPPEGVRFTRPNLTAETTVAFMVVDTGIGIAPEHLERVFTPFEQVDTASHRRYIGTGLGLTIARELSALLGGELSLTSVPGEGSTFTCYLPYVRTPTERLPTSIAAPELAPPAAAASLRQNGSPADHNHLLIIEDDPMIVERFAEIIVGQGHAYSIALNGRSGLEKARQLVPSGIILDINLPDITGWQVMEQLRADPITATIPVHFVSGLDAVERGLAMGAVGYLTKPAARHDLARVVESLTPKRAAHGPRLLIVEDPANAHESLLHQIAGENLEAECARSPAQALELLGREKFGCVILDLSLPGMDGLEFLKSLEDRCHPDTPSVVVYAARPLSKVEAQRLQAFADAVVLKEGSSSERLLEEVRLFVRRFAGRAGGGQRGASPAQLSDVRLTGRKVLVADDDMRNVYALSAMLRAKGAEVLVADTGRTALGVLGDNPDVDVVLMDIMMPEMDGYEAMRLIRQDPRFMQLPMIALTAKAMKGDPEKCIAAGANDYLPKPVDADRLLGMLRSHLTAGARNA